MENFLFSNIFLHVIHLVANMCTVIYWIERGFELPGQVFRNYYILELITMFLKKYFLMFNYFLERKSARVAGAERRGQRIQSSSVLTAASPVWGSNS